MDNSEGDYRGGNGGQGRGHGAPCAVITQTRAEEQGDGYHWQGWVGIPSAGRGGGFVPTEAAAEYPPLWPGAPSQGIGEQDPKPHTPPPLGGEP